MGTNKILLKTASVVLIQIFLCINASAQQGTAARYFVESEKSIEKNETGPHNGGGNTIAYRFFKDTPGSTLQLTRRILEPGAAIGYHLQKEEEIYYILSGTGEMNMNGKLFLVKEGDAILTMPGNYHALRQTGTTPLVVIINYLKK